MNVLFVEDDAMNRCVVADMLNVAGATMYGAESAERGFEALECERFDVVLMDLRMPGMNGFSAIARIRTMSGISATIPIIVVTADTRPALRQECLSAGADDLICKPVAMDHLFDAIGRLLGCSPTVTLR